jgi:hypothetical protein
MDYLKNNVKIKELTLNIVGVCEIVEHFGFIKVILQTSCHQSANLILFRDFHVEPESPEVSRVIMIRCICIYALL